MDNKNNVDKAKTIGYKMGQMFAVVCGFCLSAIVIALCLKFLFWLFY